MRNMFVTLFITAALTSACTPENAVQAENLAPSPATSASEQTRPTNHEQTAHIFRAREINGDVRVDNVAVAAGAIIETGASVTIGQNSSAVLVDTNKNAVHLGPNTQVVINPDKRSEGTVFQLAVGSAWSFLINGLPGDRPLFEVITEHAVAGVRGTVFFVETNPKNTYVCSCAGSVLVEPAARDDFSAIQTQPEDSHAGFIIGKDPHGKFGHTQAKRHSHTDEMASHVMTLISK